MKKKRVTKQRTKIAVELEVIGYLAKKFTVICNYLADDSMAQAIRWALKYAAENLKVTDDLTRIAPERASSVVNSAMVQIDETNKPDTRQHLERLRTMVAAMDGQTTTTNRRVIEVAVLFTAERLACRD